LHGIKERREYYKLKEEAPDRPVWRTVFGRECGLVVRPTVE
jgi:hypothetical protein